MAGFVCAAAMLLMFRCLEGNDLFLGEARCFNVTCSLPQSACAACCLSVCMT